MARQVATHEHFVENYLAALLAQASHRISSEFHEVVRRAGLSVSEWRVLATLADGRELAVGRLAQVTVIKQPTLTRLLDRMVERGQIERVAHSSDRRCSPARITPDGRALVDRLIERAREHEQRVLAPFGLKRAETLKATLRRIIEMHRATDTPGLAPGPLTPARRALVAGPPANSKARRRA